MEPKRKLLTPIKTPREVKIYRPSGTTPKRVPSSSTRKESSRVKSTVGYAARCIENYEYKKAFTFLYNNFARARRAIQSLIKFQVRKGVKSLLKNNSCILLKKFSLDNLKTFKWLDILQDIEKHIPLLYTALVSMATKPDNEKTLIGSRDKQLVGSIDLAASVLMHARSPYKSNFVQSLNAIELWRCGAQRKALKHFNHLGLCTSHTTALRNISKIRVHADDKVLKMVEDVQYCMENGFWDQPEEGEGTCSDLEMSEHDEGSSIWEESQQSSTCESSSSLVLMSEDESFEPTDDEMPEMIQDDPSTGFCLVWDNVGKMVKAAHQSTERQNKMMLWALAYCGKNRIPTSHLTDNTVRKAADITVAEFLPSTEDLYEIRHRMEIIVARILIEEVPFFAANFTECLQRHIRHRFWRESSKKSEVINLGVCTENPSTAAGTIKILEHLHQYVPRHKENIFEIVCFGDGLSCERHNDAHMARSNGTTKLDKLHGLQPQVQEFHKRMLLMQDLMDIFFSGTSATEKGTLFHLKNMFGHRSVKKDVGETFNHAAEFIKFVTYGYVILASLDAAGLKGFEDQLDIESITDKKTFIKSIAQKVVDMIWHDPKAQDIIDASSEAPPYIFCHCKEDTGTPMIHCSGVRCPGNNWFHLECVDMDEEDVPDGDYYCSDECRKGKTYQYCCHVDKGKCVPMIGCDNPNCQHGEWFHFKCVGLKKAPAGEWFCSKDCRAVPKKKGKAVQKEDGCYNYVCALTYMGLLDLVRKDAVRENDGQAMMGHWRLDMIQFHNMHHPKYVILGHRLLAGIAGWLPERLKMDSMWNRTVNLAGRPGRNLEGDIVNEFLNKEFKESLKDAGGNLTEETVYRHSQLVGSLGKVLDQAFCDSLDIDENTFIKKPKLELSKDLKMFVDCLEKEKLFTKIPGREFKIFPNFSFSNQAVQPNRLNKKMKQLCSRLDNIRRCTE